MFGDYESKAAARIANEVNVLTMDFDPLCEAMCRQHRTLQQNFTRMCFAWIKYVATHEGYRTDDRNRATQVKCKAIYEKVKNDPAWDYLPYI